MAWSPVPYSIPVLYTHERLQKVLKPGIKYISKKAPTFATKWSPGLFSTSAQNTYTWLTTNTKCLVCEDALKTKPFTSYSIGCRCSIYSHIYCNSRHVVYLAQCVCCQYVQYVGCTVNNLKTRIRRHVSDICNNSSHNISNLSKNNFEKHKGDITSFRFCGIEKVLRPIRGGDHRLKLLDRDFLHTCTSRIKLLTWHYLSILS